MTTPDFDQVGDRAFEQGQQVFDATGKSGEVTQAFFDFDGGLWVYEVTGLGTVAGDFLSGEPAPGVQVEPGAIVEEETGNGETESGGSGGIESEEIDIGTDRDISGYRLPPSGLTRQDVIDIVRSFVNVHRIEVNNQFSDLELGSDGLAEIQNDLQALKDSISELVMEQSDFEKRPLSDYESLDESGDKTLGGFIKSVSGFILSPFDSIKEAFEDYILNEVRDGLNR